MLLGCIFESQMQHKLLVSAFFLFFFPPSFASFYSFFNNMDVLRSNLVYILIVSYKSHLLHVFLFHLILKKNDNWRWRMNVFIPIHKCKWQCWLKLCHKKKDGDVVISTSRWSQISPSSFQRLALYGWMESAINVPLQLNWLLWGAWFKIKYT